MSLRNKIVLLALAIALIASVAMAVATYRRTATMSADLAAAKLAGQTNLVATELTEALRGMRADASILASTPPTQGIVRAQRAGGVDPKDGSTDELWKARLADTFISVLEARPSYFQIRFIGAADNGKELVRVNRSADGIEVVEEEDLQTKGHRPFVQLGLRLAPGEWSYSDVSYKWDYGQELEGNGPNIRGLFPIFDAQGERFGVIVINAYYSVLMARALEAVKPDAYTIIANSAGDYVVYDPKTGPSDLLFHSDPDYSVPPPLRADAQADEQGLIHEDGYAFYTAQSVIDLSRQNLVLNVATRVPEAELLAPAHAANMDSLLLGALLVLLTSGAAFVLARHLTAPLEKMTTEVERLGEGESDLSLPVEQQDEIGELARAFEEVTGDLVESEAKIRAIIEDVADGLIVADKFGYIEMFNPAAEALFDYSAIDVIGDDVSKLLPNGFGHGERKTNLEVKARRSDGSEFDAELSVSPVHAGDRELYCGIVRDISERKTVERLKSEFVSNVNHQLRTPLTSIAGSLGLLQMDAADQLEEKNRRLLELAYRGAERLTRLVNDVLDVEKIEAGKLDHRVKLVNIVEVIEEVIEQQAPLARSHGITFTFETSLPKAIVSLDPDRLEQALVNLLSNGARHSQSGSTVEVGLGLTDTPNQICLTVTDHGSGIPKEFEDRVFDRFTQAALHETKQGSGSGLGLYITKTLVDAFGGTISFTSDPGHGTTFTVLLPLAKAPCVERRKTA